MPLPPRGYLEFRDLREQILRKLHSCLGASLNFHLALQEGHLGVQFTSCKPEEYFVLQNETAVERLRAGVRHLADGRRHLLQVNVESRGGPAGRWD